MRNVLRIVAGQRVLIESTSVAAADETRIIVNTGNESSAIIGNSVTRERQELANERVGWQGRDVRATEPNDLFGIATNVEKEIGPVAGMRAVIVGQAFLASHFFGLAVSASIIENVALGRWLEKTEGVFTNGTWISSRIWSQFVNAFAAVGGPVVIAKIVNGSGTVEQQTIFASLQRQRAVSALVKLIAVGRVSVSLETVLLRT